MSTALDPVRGREEHGAVDDLCTPCPYRELRDLTRLIAQIYEAAFTDVGMTAAQHRLLSEIKRLKAPRNVDLARAVGLDPSTLSRNLKPLLSEGWIRIEEGGDARSHRVLLSASGRERQALGQRQWQVAKARVVQALGPRRVARLYGLVEECRSVLTPWPPHGAPALNTA